MGCDSLEIYSKIGIGFAGLRIANQREISGV
jgi:hypothetical protein